jgi:hypothetical protein
VNWLKDLWAKLKADAINAMALVSTSLGSAMAHIDDVAAALGDPNLNQQLHTVITDVKAWGRWMMVVGIIGTIARFKKLVQTPRA